MTTFLAAVLFVGLCVLGLGVNIFFRKDGKFPETDIASNREMRRRGIRCVKEEEMERISKHSPCSGQYTDACAGCAWYGKE